MASRSSSILFAILLCACGGDAPADAGIPDAAAPVDASAPLDAGDPMDASVPMDASDGGALDGGDPDALGAYPVEVTAGSCELLWDRWGPSVDAGSGEHLVVRGTEAWFVEREGEQNMLVHVNGLDGTVLGREPIGPAGELLSLRLGGDMDGDGIGELVLAGAVQLTEVSDSGIPSSGGVDTRVTPISAATLAPLWSRERSIDGLAGYPGVGVVADRDGDGAAEVIVSDGVRPRPPLLVLSGATGDELGSLPIPPETETFGDRMIGAGDLNGDGTEDLFVTDAYGPSDLFGVGSVYAIDGASGAVLWRVVGSTEGGDPWLLGGAEIAAVDLDGDGVNELVASAHNAEANSFSEAGKVLAYSGVDGSPLWTADGTRQWDHLGTSIAPADDVDGDGARDVVVGAEGSPFVLEGNGRAVVLRGSDGAVLIEVRSTAVQPCEDPVSPDARCYPDQFGSARALSGAAGEGIVILFGTPGALDPEDNERGNVSAMRCTP